MCIKKNSGKKQFIEGENIILKNAAEAWREVSPAWWLPHSLLDKSEDIRHGQPGRVHLEIGQYTVCPLLSRLTKS
jgi:hypothetical protein